VSDPPWGVTESGTCTEVKPGTFVVTASVPRIAVPAVDVVGIAATVIEIDPLAPGATVPEFAPAMPNTAPPVMLADHVMGACPLFVKVYVWLAVPVPQFTRPKSIFVSLSVPVAASTGPASEDEASTPGAGALSNGTKASNVPASTPPPSGAEPLFEMQPAARVPVARRRTEAQAAT